MVTADVDLVVAVAADDVATKATVPPAHCGWRDVRIPENLSGRSGASLRCSGLAFGWSSAVLLVPPAPCEFIAKA